MKVKNVEDLDENWQNTVNMHMSAKIGASRSSRCLQYIIVYFVMDRRMDIRTHKRTNEHTTCQHTPLNSVGKV